MRIFTVIILIFIYSNSFGQGCQHPSEKIDLEFEKTQVLALKIDSICNSIKPISSNKLIEVGI